jgi:ABC-type transport system involved in multi-copper enzyme maturation permease subunit
MIQNDKDTDKMGKMIAYQVRAISLNVWRESVRDRLLHLLAASGILLIFSALVLGEMAIGERQRVIQNCGLFVIGLWGLVTVIYTGSNILKREIRQKTIYMVLSRPVTRPVFLIGKFFGSVSVLFSLFCVLAAAWLILLQLFSVPLRWTHLISLAFIFGEWVLLAALSLFFASFTSPILHNFFLIGLTFLGHWSNDLYIFSENTHSQGLKILLKCIFYILPNLEALNFREAALYNLTVSNALLAEGAIVLLGWTLSALFAANLIFMKRKLI